MSQICATFEEWYLGDGTYPPLTKGQKVNLSFYVNPTDLKLTTRTDFEFKQNQYSDYNYCGRVIKIYESEESTQINIIDCGQIRFYIEGNPKIPKLKVGQFIEGHGMSHPTSLSPTDYSEKDIFEINDMRNDDGQTSFYLLDLDPINEQIEKTFI